MEVIGTYDPIPKSDPYDSSGKLHKDIKLDMVRARYWIGVGAQPRDTAWRILSMVSGPAFLQCDLRDSSILARLLGMKTAEYVERGDMLGTIEC